jgi:phytoene/squalene synthetase
LVLEAFETSGEKNYLLSKLFYSALAGSEWGFALLGFAYLKVLDNAVDEDPDAYRALRLLTSQREFIRGVYSGREVRDELPALDRFGYHLFRYDRDSGSYLRPFLEKFIETMEFDVNRRNRILSEVDLDGWAVDVGEAWLEYLGHFAARGQRLPKSFLERTSLAYIWADSIIDVENDLRYGIISIPEDDIKRFGLTLDPSDPRLDSWISAQSEKVMGYFESALAETRRLKSRRMRILTLLYLKRKRRSLSRFLERKRIRPAAQLTAPSRPETAEGKRDLPSLPSNLHR